MAATIDFYFDFMSPFSYFAWQRLPSLAKQYGREIVLHPVDLAELKIRAGNMAPSTRTMPPSRSTPASSPVAPPSHTNGAGRHAPSPSHTPGIGPAEHAVPQPSSSGASQ